VLAPRALGAVVLVRVPVRLVVLAPEQPREPVVLRAVLLRALPALQVRVAPVQAQQPVVQAVRPPVRRAPGASLAAELPLLLPLSPPSF
jgi:hypothetical protein